MLRSAVYCDVIVGLGLMSLAAVRKHVAISEETGTTDDLATYLVKRGVLDDADRDVVIERFRSRRYECMACGGRSPGSELIGTDRLSCPICGGFLLRHNPERVRNNATTLLVMSDSEESLPPPLPEAFGSGPDDHGKLAAEAMPPDLAVPETVTRAGTARRTAPPALQKMPDMIGNWRVLRPVARGGFGCVYLARNDFLERHAAIKVLTRTNDRALQWFREEARICASIESPHIVRVFDCGYHEGQMYIVMEWIDGSSLGERLREDGKLPIDEVLHIGVQCCRGLGAAHEQGVIHRDVKPDNILIDNEGVAKVTDFGIARVVRNLAPVNDDDESVIGTPQYMAPEQVHGEQVSTVTDIYSLAMTMYHLLTGHSPFGEDNPNVYQLMMRHSQQPFPSLRKVLPDAPAGLEVLLTKMSAKDMDERPASMHEVRQSLLDLLTASRGPRVERPGTEVEQAVIDGNISNNWIRVDSWLNARFDAGARTFVLDLTSVGTINSTGLVMLVRFNDRLDDHGGRLILAGVGDRLRRLFDMMGVADYFRIEADAMLAARDAAGALGSSRVTRLDLT
ncbi:MAG: protein kinase [Planctomycetota bacterium]